MGVGCGVGTGVGASLSSLHPYLHPYLYPHQHPFLTKCTISCRSRGSVSLNQTNNDRKRPERGLSNAKGIK